MVDHTKPLVSIVLGSYNGALFLSQQLNSLVEQTYPNTEIIVTDDASTDNTCLIVRSYMQRHPNIRLHAHAENAGYIKNFERGMLLAEGKYIALCDQDDIWEPEKVEELVKNIGDNRIIYCDSLLIDAQGREMGKKMSEIRNAIDYNSCLMYVVGAWAPGHAMLFKRELLAECIPFPSIVTHDFWLGFVGASRGTVKYLDKPLVRYRQHTENAIGGVRISRTGRKKVSATEKTGQARARMQLLYDRCPDQPEETKTAYRLLNKSYQSFSLQHNLLRVRLFFRFRHQILAYKKKGALAKLAYCLKMFFTLV